MVDPGFEDLEESAPAALTPAVCRGQAATVYDTCLRESNVALGGAENTKSTCLQHADDALRAYFRDMGARVTPASLTQGRGVRAEIEEKLAAHEQERWNCEDTFSQAQTSRDDSTSGCEDRRREKYDECIGICPQGGAQGKACIPESNKVPDWAACGTLQNVTSGADEGTCSCFSNENVRWFWEREHGSVCDVVLEQMEDSRYGTTCDGDAGRRWTPQVMTNAEGAPTEVKLRCVRWNGNTPDFSTATDPAGR